MAEVRNDKEMREKLLESGLFPLSVGATKPFTPSVYEDAGVPEDMRPVFHVRAMTASEKDEYKHMQTVATAKMKSAMADMSQKDLKALSADVKRDKDESVEEFEQRKGEVVAVRMAVKYYEQIPASKYRAIACKCLMGWVNFLDVNGSTIEYKAGAEGLDSDLWGLLTEEVVDQLVGYINKISGLVGVEKLGLNA